jgi:hypothetical protein
MAPIDFPSIHHFLPLPEQLLTYHHVIPLLADHHFFLSVLDLISCMTHAVPYQLIRSLTCLPYALIALLVSLYL